MHMTDPRPYAGTGDDTGVVPVVGRDREPATSRPRWVSELMHSLRASPVFALAVLITLGLAGFNGLMAGLMAFRLDFLLPGPFAQMTHFTEAIHRTHDLTFGFIFVPAVVGMLAQLRRPSKNVAGQLMALIPSVGLVLTLVLTKNTNVLQPPWITVGVAALIATVLHPTGRDFFRSFSVARINWVMLALVIIAAVPLLVFASTNIGLQRTVPDAHARPGHYGFMAAFGFTVIGVGLLASLRPDGWRLTAWVTGFLPALLGLASVVYPDATSSLGLVWALAAIVWGVGFIAAGELTQRLRATEEDTHMADQPPDTSVGRDRESTPGTPTWVKAAAIIALAAVVLFVILMLFGGGGHGPARHTATGDAGGQIPPSSGVGGPADAVQAARRFEVTTPDTMTFEPSRINVSAGETVTFVVTNTGQAVHEFTLGDAAMQQEHAGMMAHMPAGMAHDTSNSIRLQPGETKQLTWRFGGTGTIEYACHEPGHYQAGMRGQITIT